MRRPLSTFAFALANTLLAQPGRITVDDPPDSVVVGQEFTLTWTMHGRVDEQQPLDLGDLSILHGPFQEGSTSMTDGAATPERTLRYVVKAMRPGRLIVPELRATIEGARWISPPTVITVTDTSTDVSAAPAETGEPAPFGVVIQDDAGQLVVFGDKGDQHLVAVLSPDQQRTWQDRLYTLVRTYDPKASAITLCASVISPAQAEVIWYQDGERYGTLLTAAQATAWRADVFRLFAATADVPFSASVRAGTGRIDVQDTDGTRRMLRSMPPGRAKEWSDRLCKLVSAPDSSAVFDVFLVDEAGRIQVQEPGDRLSTLPLSPAQAHALQAQLRKLLPAAGAKASLYATLQQGGECYVLANEAGKDQRVAYLDPVRALALEEQLRRIVTDHSADVLQASARAGEGRLVVVPREGYQRMQALLPEQARALEAHLRACVAE